MIRLCVLLGRNKKSDQTRKLEETMAKKRAKKSAKRTARKSAKRKTAKRKTTARKTKRRAKRKPSAAMMKKSMTGGCSSCK